MEDYSLFSFSLPYCADLVVLCWQSSILPIIFPLLRLQPVFLFSIPLYVHLVLHIYPLPFLSSVMCWSCVGQQGAAVHFSSAIGPVINIEPPEWPGAGPCGRVCLCVTYTADQGQGCLPWHLYMMCWVKRFHCSTSSSKKGNSYGG